MYQHMRSMTTALATYTKWWSTESTTVHLVTENVCTWSLDSNDVKKTDNQTAVQQSGKHTCTCTSISSHKGTSTDLASSPVHDIVRVLASISRIYASISHISSDQRSLQMPFYCIPLSQARSILLRCSFPHIQYRYVLGYGKMERIKPGTHPRSC